MSGLVPPAGGVAPAAGPPAGGLPVVGGAPVDGAAPGVGALGVVVLGAATGGGGEPDAELPDEYASFCCGAGAAAFPMGTVRDPAVSPAPEP
jgi:hypothetical protein